MDLAHAEIRRHLVERITIGILEEELYVIEEWRLGAPQLGLLHGQRHDRSRCHGRRLRSDGLAAVHYVHRKRITTAVAAQRHLERHLVAVDVGGALHARESARRHSLHPYRLPDTCRSGVHALEGAVTQRLLSGRLLAAAQIALGANDQRVHTSRLDKVRNIHRERVRTAEMACHELAVDIYLRLVIYGAEVEQDILTVPRLGHRDLALVPDAGDELLMLDTR